MVIIRRLKDDHVDGKAGKSKTGSLKSTAKGSFALKWKQDKKATGYTIQYSTDKRFEKNVKSTTVSSKQERHRRRLES